MKIKLKQGIFIEGFDESIYLDCASDIGINLYVVIYKGKTSEISEELAKICVKYSGNSIKDYTLSKEPHPQVYDNKFNAKESIQSACNQKYCIIYKT